MFPLETVPRTSVNARFIEYKTLNDRKLHLLYRIRQKIKGTMILRHVVTAEDNVTTSTLDHCTPLFCIF